MGIIGGSLLVTAVGLAVIVVATEVASWVKVKNFKAALSSPEFQEITIKRDDKLKYDVKATYKVSEPNEKGEVKESKRVDTLKVNNPIDILFK